MKILNGKKYFERVDVDKCFKSACYTLVDPSLLEKQSKYSFTFDVDMLYVLPEDELDTIKEGIKKLNNTISWELTSESAVKLDVIEKCYLSLRTPASNRLSYKEYHETTLKNTTSDTIAFYENWLLDVGGDILFFFFSK